MSRRATSAILLATLVVAQGCRKIEPRALDPVRALRARVEPRFTPPQDGRLTASQVEAYLKARVAAAAGAAPELDPAERTWIAARITEALATLEARRVAADALESYARALAALREARKAAGERRVASRLDAEIAALERERASIRKEAASAAPAVEHNARLVQRWRSELEATRP